MTTPLFDIAPSGALTALEPLTLDAPPACPPATAAGGVPIFEVTVYGKAAPQGSKHGRPIYRGKGDNRVFTGKVAQVESSKSGVIDWRADVKAAAERAIDGLRGAAFPLDGDLYVEMVFSSARPKSHYRTGRNAALLRDGAPARPISPPDLSKLARSTEDALKTAGVYVDDARIAEYRRLAKVYCGEDVDALATPGAVIRIWMGDGGRD